MSKSYWKTRSSMERRERVTWPSPAQALRQIGIVILIGVVWSGLLAGCLQLTQPQGNEPVTGGTQTAKPTDIPAVSPVPAKTTDTSFAKDVLPVFQKNCVTCHGSIKNAGLDLQTYASVMKGSQNGPVIKPGKASDSLLVEFVVAGRMPRGGPPLSPAEIQTIRGWVEAGAPDN